MAATPQTGAAEEVLARIEKRLFLEGWRTDIGFPPADIRALIDLARTPTITLVSQTDAILHDLIELEAPAEHLPEPMCERLLSLIDRAKTITAIQGEE